MADALQALLGAGAVPTTSFPPTSRYATVGTATCPGPPQPGGDPAPIAYLRRRLVPPPERFALLYEITAVEGDRPDLLAAQQLGDSELWWRLADANCVIDPATLTMPVGRRIRVTLPENVIGPADG